MHCLSSRCPGIRAQSGAFASVTNAGDEKEEELIELITKTACDAQADVLILGGAPLARFADRIKARIPVPLVDPVQAAVKQAEALVALQSRKAEFGTFSRPPAKNTTGLTEALARRIGRRDS